MDKTKKNNAIQLAALDESPEDPTRRSILKGAGLAGAAVVSSATTSPVLAAESGSINNSNEVSLEALEVLTASEAEILDEICDCLIPSDDNGPGAKEARAVHYIDRSLASHNSDARQHYLFSLAAINEHAQRKYSAVFASLTRNNQNEILTQLQNDEVLGCSPGSANFFALIREHTVDGTFCDPYYGGNQNFVGWDMLRYPGIRLSASETDVLRGADLEPNHQSAYDYDTYTKMAANIKGSNQGGSHNA